MIFDVIPEKVEIGSRVRIIRDTDGHDEWVGLTGTVVYKFDSLYSSRYDWGIDFGKVIEFPDSSTHSMKSRLEHPTGRWFAEHDLQPV